MDFYVYAHRKATTGEIFYIDKGTGRRAWSASDRTKYWRSTVKKHGLKVEIIQDGLQEWAAFEMECDLIALHGRKDRSEGHLVNLVDGGQGASGRVLSEQSREKHKLSIRAKFQDPLHRAKMKAVVQATALNPEWRAKNQIAAVNRGNDSEWRAKMKTVISEKYKDKDYRDKIKAAAERRASDPGWKLKNIEQMRKMHLDEGYRSRFSEAMKVMHSDPAYQAKQRESVRKANSKPILCVETGQEFFQVSAAIEWLRSNGKPKANQSAMSAIAKGKQQTAYGYHWVFLVTT